MKNRLALLFAVLGFATMVCLLVFSRDNKLAYQQHPQAPPAQDITQGPAHSSALSPTIQTLSEVPAPAAATPQTPASGNPSTPKAEVPKTASKAKG